MIEIMTDNIYLRCSVIVLLCATTFAAPGGFGSFAGSSASAFSSASSNAQAGSVASAISSTNAFTGGTFPSKNPDGTSHGLTHQHGISVGSGSYVGTGNINPGSDKFGLNHQGYGGIKGGHNNHKSQSPCSECPHTKWEYDNYDEQPEEKEDDTHGEDEEHDDCDDGQYRPEHHYKHDKSGDGKKEEEETVTGVHKIGNSDQYNYDEGNNKGAYTPSSNKDYDNKNFGTPGIIGPISGVGNNYGNTNKGPFGGVTPSQSNLGSVNGANTGCTNTGSGGGCSTSGADSSVNQGPVKIGQKDFTQTSNAPSLISGGNKGISGCNSLYENCGNGINDGTGQYQSTSVGNGHNLHNEYTGGSSTGNKPQSYNQQPTGQWIDQSHKGNLPSGSIGNVGVGSGCTPGSPSSACSDKGTPLEKNLPIPTQTYGTGGSGSGQIGIGSKPIPTQTYGTVGSGHGNIGIGSQPTPIQTYGTVGSGTGQIGIGAKPIPTQTYGTVGSGHGNIGVGSKPIPTQTYGTIGSGVGNIGLGNKPHSYDQQHTVEPNKGNLPSGPAGNVGVGSGCTPGSPSSACSDKGTPLEKNLPIPTQTYGTGGSGSGQIHSGSKPAPTQTYGTVGSGHGNVGVGSKPIPTQPYGTIGSGVGNIGLGNKPHSYDQHTVQQNKGNLPSGSAGNVGVGSGCTPGSPSSACSDKGTPLEKNLPIPPQTYGTGGSGSGQIGIGSKPIPTQTFGTVGSGHGNIGVGSKPIPTQTFGTVGSGHGNIGVGSKPIPTQTYGTIGSGVGNIGLGNKPHSYDQQHTVEPNKGNLPSGPAGNVGVGSGCTPGSPSSACSDKGTPLEKNLPIPTQTYGTGGSGSGQIGIGSKPIPTQTYGTVGSGHGNIGIGSQPTPIQTYGTVGSGTGQIGIGAKPIPTQTYGTVGSGHGNIGVGSKPIPTQTYETIGSGVGNIGLGNKPHSYDQQHTVEPNKGNLPSGPAGNVGVGSGCTLGSPSSACSDKGTPLEKNLPIPTQTYGTVGSGHGNIGVGSKPFPTQTYGTIGSGVGNIGLGNKPIPTQTYGTVGSGHGNIGVGGKPIPTQTYGTIGSGVGSIDLGNKPHSYDQHTVQPNKGNLPSGPAGYIGVGSGCSPGSPSSACSDKGTPLEKNLPIPTQTYGTGGSESGQIHSGSKPAPTQTYGTVGSGHGNVGVGSKPIPTQTYGTIGSGVGNIGLGNKPHSYDQHTVQQNKGNLPSGSAGNVGVGSGCSPGLPSSACSDKGTPLEKNLPIPAQTYGTGGSGSGQIGIGSKPIPTQTYGTVGSGHGNVGVGSKPIPTQTYGTIGSGVGNIGLGNKPHSYDQHIVKPSKGNLPSVPTGNVGVGSGSTTGVSSASCNDDGTPLQKVIPISSQTFGTAGSGFPVGSSQAHAGASSTTGIGSGFNFNTKPIHGDQNSYQFNTGNPFLHGGQVNFKPIIYTTSSPSTNGLDTVDTTDKAFGLGNPFLDGTITNTFGSQHVINEKPIPGVTPIKNDVPNKPIGVGNPFLSTITHPGKDYNNENTAFGSGTLNPFSKHQGSTQFSNSKQIPEIPGVIGLTNSNTNQGVKGGQQHNPTFGSFATSNAGAFSTGLNTPNAYNNNNNAGHGTGSLIGTANIKKPSYTLLNSPGSLSQTSGSSDSANGNGNSLSNSLNDGNNQNGQYHPQIANAGAQSFAGASAGSYAGSFSSSQASSSSSSFASSKSGSYSANGDPNILHQLNGNLPFGAARNLDGTNPGWSSFNAGSQASAFASSSAGSWSGSQPFGVKSR